MKRSGQKFLCGFSSFAALAAASGGALAQTDEIIVTAQKREQSLQDVPLAVTAFSGDNIDNKTIDDSVDLSFSVPNLTVAENGAASLRGVAEEAGFAYKDVDEVAAATETAGLSKRVVHLVPVGNVKG